MIHLLDGSAALPAAAPGGATFYMEIGAYTGSGQARTINLRSSFDPEFVWVRTMPESGTQTIVRGRFDTEVAVECNEIGGPRLSANRITNIVTNGFQLGTNVDVNQNNLPYIYLAFGGSTLPGSTFAYGEWTGDGDASHSVTTPFAPDLVWVLPVETNLDLWAVRGSASGFSHFFLQSTSVERVTFDPSGFTLNADGAGQVYRWAAWQNVAGGSGSGTYVGDGAASHAISDAEMAGVVPHMKLVARSEQVSPYRSYYRAINDAGDEGHQPGEASPFVTQTGYPFLTAITGESVGQFTVGSSFYVNQSGTDYDYFWWKEQGP